MKTASCIEAGGWIGIITGIVYGSRLVYEEFKAEEELAPFDVFKRILFLSGSVAFGGVVGMATGAAMGATCDGFKRITD